jgi:TonB family protein
MRALLYLLWASSLTVSAPPRIREEAAAVLKCPKAQIQFKQSKGDGWSADGCGHGVWCALPAVDGGQSVCELFGSLEKEGIRLVVQQHLEEVRGCYQRELATFPTLAGKITIKFIISPNGSVRSARVGSTRGGNANLAECVAAEVRTWRFDVPNGGGIVLVTYPFIFKPAARHETPKRESSTVAARAETERATAGVGDHEDPQDVIRKHMSELQTCYDRELASTLNLAGKMTLRWQVAASGTVSSVQVVQSSGPNIALEQCVGAAVGSWRFPMPKDESAAAVTHTFIFKLREDGSREAGTSVLPSRPPAAGPTQL